MERILEHDAHLLAELQGFLPDLIFDSHAHLYNTATWRSTKGYDEFSPPVVDLDVYRQQMAMLFGQRRIHAMFFPYPVIHKNDSGFGDDNAWVAREVTKDPLSCGQMLVRPTDDYDWVAQEMHRLGLRGLKPFSTYAAVQNPWEARLCDFLPEALVAVAHQQRWSVTVHLMRKGIADPENRFWIRRYCEAYPHMQMILDHCARGFSPYWVLAGLQELKDLPNLWIDTSVVCDPFSIEAVLRIMGPEKVLYGSDFCMSHVRGINFGVAQSFMWLDSSAPIWHGHAHEPQIKPTLVGIENLRAIRAAMWAVGSSDREVEDFFAGNAQDLLF